MMASPSHWISLPTDKLLEKVEYARRNSFGIPPEENVHLMMKEEKRESQLPIEYRQYTTEQMDYLRQRGMLPVGL